MQHLFKFIPKLQFLINLDKRQRFALQTIILTFGLLVTQLIWEDYRFIVVVILSIMSYFLTAWSLSEDIKGIEWILLYILPVSLTLSFSLFYFLLPGRWISRLFIIFVFAIGTYATLLAENIYNVAAARSIQLLRVAQSVGLLITLVVVFLSVSIIFSIRGSFLMNMFLLTPVVFVLGLQSLWSVKLEARLSREVIIYAAVVALGIGEMVAALSFWPIQIATISLFTSALFYTLIGIIQQHFLGRLFKNIIKEYIFAFIFTFLVAVLITSWG